MGTILYARGIYINQCYDAINLSKPHLIKSIHLEYIRIGAEVIETNASAPTATNSPGAALSGKVREINLTAAGPHTRGFRARSGWPAASGRFSAVNSPRDRIESAERQDIFREQIKALIEGEVDSSSWNCSPEIAQLAEDAVAAAQALAPDCRSGVGSSTTTARPKKTLRPRISPTNSANFQSM